MTELEDKLVVQLGKLKAGRGCWCATPDNHQRTCKETDEVIKEYIKGRSLVDGGQIFTDTMSKRWRF